MTFYLILQSKETGELEKFALPGGDELKYAHSFPNRVKAEMARREVVNRTSLQSHTPMVTANPEQADSLQRAEEADAFLRETASYHERALQAAQEERELQLEGTALAVAEELRAAGVDIHGMALMALSERLVKLVSDRIPAHTGPMA